MGDPGSQPPFTVEPIGVVHSPRTEPIDDDWGDVESTIELDSGRFTADSLRGLDEISHLEVVYLFHLVDPGTFETRARRPRGREDWPEVGIFAQRTKRRPNRIGVGICQLLGVDGLAIAVRGLDAIDGTPVIDLKPYMSEFAPRQPVRQPQWSRELMEGYW